MKKKSLIIQSLALSLSLGFFFSCNENELPTEVVNSDEASFKIPMTQAEAISIAFDDTNNELSEDEATAHVKNFNLNLNNQTRSSSTITNIKISNKYYIGNNANTRNGGRLSIPFYEVKFLHNGTEGQAVVSGDKRAPGVIAYIEKEDSESEANTGKQYMLEVAQQSTMSEIRNVISIQDSLREKTINRVAFVLGISKEDVNFDKVKNSINITDQTITRSPAYDTPLSAIVANKDPLITVKWGQSTPYNMLLPYCSEEYDHYFWDADENLTITTKYRKRNRPAGCGVTAIAEALTYLKPALTINGMSMNWNLLTQDPRLIYSPWVAKPDMSQYPQANMAATLVKYIYEQTKATPKYENKNSNYPSESSDPVVSTSSITDTNFKSFMQTVSNLNEYRKWAPDEILASVMGDRISIVLGCPKGNTSFSHAWIIDGYAQCTKTNRAIIKQYDLYFHASMGWDGTNDGYYRFNSNGTIDFETDSGTFNSIFCVYANIRKK